MSQSPRPVHYYHLWVGDRYHGSRWKLVAEEHFNALRAAEFYGEVCVGLVGGAPERGLAEEKLEEWWPEAAIVVQETEGFEQVTIEALHAFSKDCPPATPLLYCHNKGSFNNNGCQDPWRRNMTKHLIGGWQACVNSLHSYDAVGLHWVTHEQFPEYIHPLKPMFGGNFWWVNAGYLAQLGPIPGGTNGGVVNRWGAEGWMGTGFPSVLDLDPGWPDYTGGIRHCVCGNGIVHELAASCPGWPVS